jgi:hypothetical protein
MRGASTDALVKLVLYGHKGKCDNIELQTESGRFECGYCDEFKIDINDIGVPFKLRVSLDNKNFFSAWHLDRVRKTKALVWFSHLRKCLD